MDIPTTETTRTAIGKPLQMRKQQVPPKECQNAICFGGSLINVVVPVDVIP
jgi:hypothetical protein